MGKTRIPGDSLPDLRANSHQYLGQHCAIEDRRNKFEDVVIVDAAKLPVPHSKNGEEDFYFRFVDREDWLLKAIKVRDAALDLSRSRLPKYKRLERSAAVKATALYGGDEKGKQALKSSRLEGARVRIWREIECKWLEGSVENLVRRGQTEHTWFFVCTVLGDDNTQIPDVHLNETSWELLDTARASGESGGGEEDRRSKRRRKRVDVSEAYGIYEGNVNSHGGGRRTRTAPPRPESADPGQGHSGRARHSVPDHGATTDTDDGDEFVHERRRGRRKSTTTRAPTARGRSATGRGSRGRGGRRKAIRQPSSTPEPKSGSDDDVEEPEAFDRASDSMPDAEELVSQPSADAEGAAESQSLDEERILEDEAPEREEQMERAAARPTRGGRGGRRGGRGRGTRGRGAGGRAAMRRRSLAGDLSEPATAERRPPGRPKRRRETQSPLAPAPDAEHPDAADGSASAAKGSQQRAAKARRRELADEGAGAEAEQAASASAAAAKHEARGTATTRRALHGAEEARGEASGGRSTRSGGTQMGKGAGDASHSVDDGSRAGDPKRTRTSSGRAATRSQQGQGREAVSDAAAAGGGHAVAAAAAGEGSMPGASAGAQPGSLQRPAGSEAAAEQAQDVGHATLPRGGGGRGAASRDAHAAAVSRGSRGRSRGKGAGASEVTQSEVTKDSVGMGSRDGSQRRRVAGVPLPAGTAPGHGEIGILSNRRMSHADTAGTAEAAPSGLALPSGLLPRGIPEEDQMADAVLDPADMHDADAPGVAGGCDDDERMATASEGEGQGVAEGGAGGAREGEVGEVLGRGARQAALREAQEVADAMEQVESRDQEAPAGREAEELRAGTPGSGRRGGKQGRASPMPNRSQPTPKKTRGRDAKAEAVDEPEDHAAAATAAEDGVDRELNGGDVTLAAPSAEEQAVLVAASAAGGPDSRGGVHDALPSGPSLLHAGANGASGRAISAGDPPVDGQEEGGGALGGGRSEDGADAGAEAHIAVAEVGESEEEILPKKRQKRPSKKVVAPSAAPPAAAPPAQQGSPGEASSEGGRSAARRARPTDVAPTSQARKSQPSIANGVGAPAGAAAVRRGRRGQQAVDAARAVAAPAQPQVPTRPRVDRAPAARPVTALRLGPESLVGPTASNKFVRTRPSSGLQPLHGSLHTSDHTGSTMPLSRVEDLPESPPSLLPPDALNAVAAEQPDDAAELALLEPMRYEDAEPGEPEEGLPVLTADDEPQQQKPVDEVGQAMAEVAHTAVSAMEAAAAAVADSLMPMAPPAGRPAQVAEVNAALADPELPVSNALPVHHAAISAAAAAREAAEAAVAPHTFTSAGAAGAVGEWPAEAAPAAAAAAATAAAAAVTTDLMGVTTSGQSAQQIALAPAHRTLTAFGEVHELQHPEQHATVQSPLPSADELQRKQLPPLAPSGAAAAAAEEAAQPESIQATADAAQDRDSPAAQPGGEQAGGDRAPDPAAAPEGDAARATSAQRAEQAEGGKAAGKTGMTWIMSSVTGLLTRPWFHPPTSREPSAASSPVRPAADDVDGTAPEPAGDSATAAEAAEQLQRGRDAAQQSGAVSPTQAAHAAVLSQVEGPENAPHAAHAERAEHAHGVLAADGVPGEGVGGSGGEGAALAADVEAGPAAEEGAAALDGAPAAAVARDGDAGADAAAAPAEDMDTDSAHFKDDPAAACAALDSEMQDVAAGEPSLPHTAACGAAATLTPGQHGAGLLQPAPASVDGSGTLLQPSPPASPVADASQNGDALLEDGPEEMRRLGSLDLPLAEQLAQPADIDMEDAADVDPLAALSDGAPAGLPQPPPPAAGVFAQSGAGTEAAAAGGAEVDGHGGLTAATSLELLRQNMDHAPGATRAQRDRQAAATSAAARTDHAPPEQSATAPAATAATAAAEAGAPAATAPEPAAPAAAAEAAPAAAPPAIRAKRSARAPPPPVTVPPPPAAVAPRENRKAKIRIARRPKKAGGAPAQGTSPTGAAAAAPEAGVDGGGAPGTAVRFICTEGGGPCSGMERLAPLSDPQQLIPSDQTIGQRLGLGMTPAGPALVWEVDLDNVHDLSTLQFESGERGAQLTMYRPRSCDADCPQGADESEDDEEPEVYRGNNGAQVGSGPEPTTEELLRAERVAYTMVAPQTMRLETVSADGVRAEATPAPGVARLTFRLRDGFGMPPTT
eukprot:jgi/Ulvmu1/1926/UM012_0086.1